MKKFILKLLAFLLALCIVVLSLDFVFKTNNTYTYKMLNEMYEENTNIDAVILGSSHAYKSFDTTIANDIMGLNTFNAGSSVQGMNTSYYLLKEISKYHKLKYVFLDTNPAVYKVSANDSNVYYVSQYMKNSKNKFDLLKSAGNEGLLNGYVTIRRDIENVNIISNITSRFTPLNDYSKLTNDREEYRGKGFVYSKTEFEITEDNLKKYQNDDYSKLDFSDNYNEYFKKIVDYCKENSIELILVEHPMPDEFFKTVKGYDDYKNYYIDIAKEYSLQYWNFNYYNTNDKFTEEDYADLTHLSGIGAQHYTNQLSTVAKDYFDNKDVSGYFDYN